MTRFLAAFVVIAVTAPAQVPRGTATITLNAHSVSIDYGRPSLKGRDMLAKAPVGTVWRLGADQATTMTLTGVTVFGNIVAREGSFSLFLQRTEDKQWMLLLNRQTGQWGTEHDASKDLMAIPLKWETQEESTEKLTIELTPQTKEIGQLSIRWGTNVLKQNFRIPPLP
ncbi:MAG: DUF2911 domain-containing protein [Acidobacteria bacterium]|nr:MAG: DUF2911 domain-containing protein [Acidobacteriota bacterium]